MSDFIKTLYSPKEISQVIISLRKIESLLQRIFREREYDEWTKGSINRAVVIELQEELKQQYNFIIDNHLCLLVSLFSLGEVKLWTDWVYSATSDIRAINTDIMPRYGENLKRAISRIDPWTCKIGNITTWTIYWWSVIKRNWLSYFMTLIFGLGVNMLSECLIKLFK